MKVYLDSKGMLWDQKNLWCSKAKRYQNRRDGCLGIWSKAIKKSALIGTF